jgi:hypothetical protein
MPQLLPNRLGELRLAVRSVLTTLLLAGAQLLTADLHHLPDTDPKSIRKLGTYALVLLVGRQDPQPQIVCINSRHRRCAATVANSKMPQNLPTLFTSLV